MEPGARLVRLRRLKGGISTRTFDALYARPDGTSHSVVLRIFVPDNYHGQAESVVREWRTLEVLERHGLATPRPLFLDSAGDFFAAPCMVTSRLPGGPVLYPRSWTSFVNQLAAALEAVHRLTPGTADLSHLGSGGSPADDVLAGPLHEKLAGNKLAERAWLLLRARWKSIDPLPLALVHDDFWPGNTVWYRGRLSGVIDWSSACIGDPRTDVAQCRVDLTLIYGEDRADEFAAACASLAGASALQDLWFWDAYLSLNALANLHYFVEGYFDLGLRDQAADQRRARLEAFLSRALSRANGS